MKNIVIIGGTKGISLQISNQDCKASAKKHPMQRIGKPDDIAQIACFL